MKFLHQWFKSFKSVVNRRITLIKEESNIAAVFDWILVYPEGVPIGVLLD